MIFHLYLNVIYKVDSQHVLRKQQHLKNMSNS